MVAVYSQQLAEYWFLIATPFAVLALLVGFRNYRKQKKETDDWLKGDIRNRNKN
jgi:hypothetical protein